MSGLKPFRNIPKDILEWTKWMEAQDVSSSSSSSTSSDSQTIDELTVGDIDFQSDSGLSFGEISVTDNSTETAIAVQGTAVQITIFDTNGKSNNTYPDHTSDHITIDSAGVYLINVSATINSIAGAASRAEITVMKNNGASEIIPHVDRNLAGGGGESGVISISGLANLNAQDTVEVWIENETNTQNYVVEDISLCVVQVGGSG